MNPFEIINDHIKALPAQESVVPYVKGILMIAPAMYVDDATKATVSAWAEPYPTPAQVRVTRTAYDAGPHGWEKMREMLEALQMSCQLHEVLEQHKGNLQ